MKNLYLNPVIMLILLNNYLVNLGTNLCNYDLNVNGLQEYDQPNISGSEKITLWTLQYKNLTSKRCKNDL